MTFVRVFWPAIVAATIVGAAAPAVGAFVVQKRLSLIGDGIGHVAFAGVAVGLWLGVSPLAAAIAAAILGAVGIDRLRRRSPDEADMALALFFYGSIATAVFVASLTGSFNVKIFGILFGQLLTVTRGEVLAIGLLGAAAVAVIAAGYRGFSAAAIDEDSAWAVGVPVGGLNAILMILTATVIAVGMQIVGILLIAALMVLPVGVARNLVRSFRATVVAASVTGAVCAVAGIALARAADAAPGGAIVLVAVALLLVSGPLGRVTRRA